MKSYKQVAKKYTAKEISESLVFPGTRDKKKKEAELSELRSIRKKIAENQTGEEKAISQLLQLRFLIEDYIKDSSFNDRYYFGYFLKEYISRIEKKSKEFAKEIDVNPTELSQIINKHRKPTDKLIFRLEIHSNRNFPALLWFKVLEKERAYELLHDKEIINKEKRHVKEKLAFSF